ncbi:MAG TPA: hypothetical protein VNW92_26430, partial [Polyangiaceae bacterium]|nr:hypothetical protein [Polyangiaceae bacterium]
MIHDSFKQPRRSAWLVVTAAGLLLAGCDATQQLRAASAAQTGCAPQDIQITDDDPELNSRSWVAWCNSERYQCFGTRNTISCKAAAETPALASNTAEMPSPKRAAPSWADHELRECGVSAEFPGAPKDEADEVPTKDGPTKLTLAMFELPDGKGEMSVGCTASFPKEVVSKTALDGARDGMLKNIGAHLGSERAIIGGRELLFEVQGQQGMAHLLLLKNRIVVATVMPVGAF